MYIRILYHQNQNTVKPPNKGHFRAGMNSGNLFCVERFSSLGGLKCIVQIIPVLSDVSFVDRFVILYPYLGRVHHQRFHCRFCESSLDFKILVKLQNQNIVSLTNFLGQTRMAEAPVTRMPSAVLELKAEPIGDSWMESGHCV